MSIQKKVNLGVLAMLVYMIILAIFTYDRLSSIQQVIKEDIQISFENVQVVGLVRYALANEAIQLRDYAITNSSEAKANFEEAANETTGYQKKLQKMAKEDVTLKEDVDLISSGIEEYNAKSNEVASSIESKANQFEIENQLIEAKNIRIGFSSAIEDVVAAENKKLTTLNQKLAGTVNMSKIIAAIVSILGIINAIVFLLFIRRSLLKPIAKVSAQIKQLAKRDYTQPNLAYQSKNEIGDLIQSVNDMKENTKNLVQNISDNSAHLSASIEELSASTTEVSQAAEDISQQIELISVAASNSSSNASDSSAAMNETAVGVQRIAQSSQQLFDDAKESNNLAIEGKGILKEAKDQMVVISHSSNQTNDLIKKLAHQTNEIQNMSRIITEITDQTNLLALNAAIEAARAGEHGKGFAVVAEEVRKLAEESKSSASEIVNLTSTIQADTTIVAKSVQNGLENVEQGVRIIENAQRAFATIENSVERMTTQIEDITATSEQLSAGTEEVTAAVAEIANHAGAAVTATSSVTAASEEQAATLQEINHVVSELSNQAVQLNELTQVFKV